MRLLSHACISLLLAVMFYNSTEGDCFRYQCYVLECVVHANRRNAATVFETQRSQANAKFAAHFPTGGVDSAGKLVQTWLKMATQRDNVCAYVEDK